jgi:hypothetical protein
MKDLHQNQGRKPIHAVSITTDTGKTAVLTHSQTLSEFITSSLNGTLCAITQQAQKMLEINENIKR